MYVIIVRNGGPVKQHSSSNASHFEQNSFPAAASPGADFRHQDHLPKPDPAGLVGDLRTQTMAVSL